MERYRCLGLCMYLSKSFGYALRGILYVAVKSETQGRVQLDEIANRLAVPRHFLAKVMKNVVKAGILTSVKGPYGGFCINDKTMGTPIMKIVELSGDAEVLDSCVLRFRKCSSLHPCPLHNEVDQLRCAWINMLTQTTLADLLKKKQPEIIESLSIML